METVILRIDQPPPGGDRYTVSLTKSPGNELLGTAEFQLDLAPQGMATARTAQQIRDTFAQTTSQNTALSEIGAQLYALVGQDKIHDELDTNGGARRLLLDIQPVELRTLPWELMVRNNVALMCAGGRPICRGTVEGAPLQDPEWPLRVLIVDGGEPANKNDVQAKEEIAEIIKGISHSTYEADIDLLVLKRPLRKEILEAFVDPLDVERPKPHQGFKPHIFHFIGHGNVIGGDAFLQLWDENGTQSEIWQAMDITTDFAVPNRPRLVILNACKTAQAAESGLWSVTNAFQEAKIPAVIGMRANVTGPDAREFSSSLYRAFAMGQALDEAVLAARRQLFSRSSLNHINWAAPTLEVSTNPETIITVGRHIDDATRQRVQQIADFSTVRGLVDRRDDRSGAWRRVSGDQRKVVVVRGEPEVGKTEFVRLLMERCALSKHQIRYVNMKGLRGADVLAVLRRICDGDGTGVDDFSLTSPLPEAAFKAFKDTVQTVLGSPLSKDSRFPTTTDVDSRRIFKAFQEGLEQSAVTPPLVIVLDHLEEVDKEQFQTFLLRHLITWCDSRPNRSILLVLLVKMAEYDDFALEKVRNNFRVIDIPTFKKEVWEDLAREFVWRNLEAPSPGAGPIQAMDQLITWFGNVSTGDWQPGLLRQLESTAKVVAGWRSR